MQERDCRGKGFARAACLASVLALLPVASPAADPGEAAFQWTSSAPLILPQPDAAHASVSVKDPTVVFVNGTYHVFMTTADDKGWHIAYTHFTDWSKAAQAPVTYLDQGKIGPGYRAAPQVFYFAPRKQWYLIFQGGDPLYSTTSTIDDPMSWSAPKPFFDKVPDLVRRTVGPTGYWLDFWNICDARNCYLFGADDQGHIYRSDTTVEQFPNGYSNTVIAMQDADRAKLFEASMTYKVAGADLYITAVEAMGPKGRYFRSWISDRLDGDWHPLADSLENAFAGAYNVSFKGAPWSLGVSHGELLRDGVDQTMTVDFCKPLRFLYQGLSPDAGGDYIKLPYRLGLLTATRQPDLCSKAGVAAALAAVLPGGGH